ncbi:hypothetical protein RUND412_005415 [Rhizina undulata]
MPSKSNQRKVESSTSNIAHKGSTAGPGIEKMTLKIHEGEMELSSSDENEHSEEEMASLGKILESMMAATRQRRKRKRKEIELGYNNALSEVGAKANKILESRKNRIRQRHLRTLNRFQDLLERRQKIETRIFAAITTWEDAYQQFLKDFTEVLDKVDMQLEASGDLSASKGEDQEK